jgi:uncharacterized protein (DUF1697 family)
MSAPRTYAALLRGINVGAARKVPMAELAELFAGLGHADVSTYIQSGNVVFSSSRAEPTIAPALEAAIDKRFGVEVRVLLRCHAELVAVEAANPFGGTRGVHVVFFQRAPSTSAAARLDPDRSPGDSFALAGRELFLQLPTGAGRTKLTLGYLEKQLGVAGTQRNWNTLLRLIALTEPGAAG